MEQVQRIARACSVIRRSTAIGIMLYLLLPSATFVFCAAQLLPDTLDLARNNPLAVILPGGSTIVVNLGLHGSGAGELLIKTSGPNIGLRLLSADGSQIRAERSLGPGWLIIAFSSTAETRLLLQSDGSTNDRQSLRIYLIPIELSSLSRHAKAEVAFLSGQALLYSLRAEDVRRAVVNFASAEADWHAANDPLARAVALSSQAEAFVELSQYPKALQALDDAVALTARDSYLQAWLAARRAQAYLDEWESIQAQRASQQALDSSRAVKDGALVADTLTDRGNARYLTHDAGAIDDIEQALLMARSLGVPETVARALRCKAWIEEDQGRVTDAISTMMEAQSYFRKAGDERNILEAISDITTMEGMSGLDYMALSRHIKLASITRGTGNRVNYGFIIENIGTEYVELNRRRVADYYFRMASHIYEKANFRSGELFVRGEMCTAEIGSKDFRRAQRDCMRAAVLAKQMRDPKRIAITKWRIGQLELALGETLQAAQELQSAAEISKSVHDARFEAETRVELASGLYRLHRKNEALGELEAAKSLGLAAEDQAIVLEARYRIASLYADGGDIKRAKKELSPALQQIEAARRLVADSILQASYFAAMRKCYELYVDLLMTEYKRDPTSGADATALEMSEAGRARGLLDAVDTRDAGRLTAVDVRRKALLSLRITVDQLFDQRLKLLTEGGQKRELQDNAGALTQAVDTLRLAEDSSQSSSRLLRSAPQIITAREIETASRESDGAFFEYSLGTHRSFLWVFDRGALTTYVLPPRDQIERMVKRWRELVLSAEAGADSLHPSGVASKAAAEELQHLSVELSCTLFSSSIDVHMRQLIIVPDGDLAMLPFSALPENPCDSYRLPHRTVPLLVRHEIVLIPSLSIYLSAKAPEKEHQYGGEVAVVADPVFDPGDSRMRSRAPSPMTSVSSQVGSEPVATLPRLLNTRFEAAAIKEAVGSRRTLLELGFNASLQTVLSPAMRAYRIWHFATHGIYDRTAPEFSALVFSLYAPDGSPVAGFLKADDIAHIDVTPELVVLSACDSAAGESVSGEGVMGLSYSFLRAGAKRVISTLWEVDDTTSKELMTTFYQEMVQNGNDAAAALRQSQLAVMREHSTSAPYYWAGFALTSTGK